MNEKFNKSCPVCSDKAVHIPVDMLLRDIRDHLDGIEKMWREGKMYCREVKTAEAPSHKSYSNLYEISLMLLQIERSIKRRIEAGGG